MILIKIQRILLKLALTVEDLDVGAWNFEEGPMKHKNYSDLQLVFHLMEFFLEDLNQAIVQQELSSIIEVPQLFTELFLLPIAINRGIERNRSTDISHLIKMAEEVMENPENPIKEKMTFKTLVLKVTT